MSAPIVERLREALRTHSLRQDARGYQIWLGEAEVKEAATIIEDLLAAFDDVFADQKKRIELFGNPAIGMSRSTEHKVRAAIAKAKGGVP